MNDQLRFCIPDRIRSEIVVNKAFATITWVAGFAFTIVMTGFTVRVTAQNQITETRLLAVQKARNDTSKVRALISLSDHLREVADFNQAQIHAVDALAIAEAVRDKRGIAHAQTTLGAIHLNQRRYAEALDLFITSQKLCEENAFRDLIATNKSFTGAVHNAQGNIHEGLKKCQDALQSFEQLGNLKGQVLSHYHLGTIYRSQGNFTDAIRHFSTSLNIARELGYLWGIAANHSTIGTIHGGRGEYADALNNFQAALAAWEQLGNKTGVGDTYHHFGAVHFFMANYAEAMHHYMIALKIRQESGDTARMADSYHDIGHIYLNQENCAEALNNYQQALNLFLKFGNKERIAKAYGSIGLAYSELGDMSKALENLEASIAIQEERDDKPGLIFSYNNIGRTYLAKKQYALAKKNLLSAANLATDLGNSEGLSQSYSHLGNLYTQIDSFDKARQYLERSITLSRDIGSKSGAMWGYYFLTIVDSATGNFRHALVNHKLYKLYTDSIIAEEKDRVLADLKVQYETAKKDHEIQQLEDESVITTLQLKRQTMLKNYFIAGLLLFGLLSYFVYNYFMTRQKLKLQTLRNKIATDLHDDVGSTLSSIAIFSEMAQHQSKETMPLLRTIEDSSRKMLDAMADIVWTINPENDQLERIILRMRSYAYELLGAKRIGFDFTADENIVHVKLPMDVRKNLYLIFKEATNNLVKYSEADKALFSIKADKQQLSMLIRDNGKGFDVNKQTEGNGLKNMKKRALEVGGELVIESSPENGTLIELKIAV